MSIAAVLALTAFVIAAWCLWFARRGPAEMLVYGGFAAAAQIVLVQLWLGVAGLLTARYAGGANAVLAAVVAADGFRRLRAAGGWQVAWWRSALAAASPALFALLALAAVALAWLLAAAWFLPPRGVDDISYHLPPLYRALQTGRFELLPMAIREGFALPLDAELLFLWPMLLMGEDRLVDVAQIVAAGFGAVVLHALARNLGVDRRDAPVLALCFPFVPVVLAQAGSNYIDVIVAVLHFTLLYAALRYWLTGETLHLVVAGWATGFALGAKYTMLPLVVVAQLLVVGALVAHRRRALANYALYWVSALPLGAWWYLRNYREFGDPMYPFRITAGGLVGAPGSRMETTLGISGPTAFADFVEHPLNALVYPLQDPGFGSLHGGFGVLCWGLGTPALAWCLVRAAGRARHGDWLPLAFWSQPLAAFGLYIVTVHRDGMQWDQRYILGLTGLALCAIGLVLREVRRELPAVVAPIRAFCVAASALALVHLGASRLPPYAIAPAVADRAAGTATSDYRYHQLLSGFLGHLAMAWDPLDYLTRDGPGLSVYMALPFPAFAVTAGFGSRAQNRLLDLEPASDDEPDAIVFAERRPDLPLFFPGRRITPVEVRDGGRYELVTQTEFMQFWISRARLGEPRFRSRLAAYYQRAFAAEVEGLRPWIRLLPADVAVLTSAPLGPALKYFELSGELAAPVRLVRPGAEFAEARRLGLQRVVTLDRPLPGYASRVLAPERAGGLRFVENVAP